MFFTGHYTGWKSWSSTNMKIVNKKWITINENYCVCVLNWFDLVAKKDLFNTWWMWTISLNFVVSKMVKCKIKNLNKTSKICWINKPYWNSFLRSLKYISKMWKFSKNIFVLKTIFRLVMGVPVTSKNKLHPKWMNTILTWMLEMIFSSLWRQVSTETEWNVQKANC